VTPFDAAALLAMLLAFYPVVSVPTLQRARAERPEYFAAGTLGGSKGEKLFLQDGRVFDLIAAAGGPPSGRHWQVIDVTNDPGGAADPFALEEGPLTPLDEDDTVPAPPGETFTALVADELDAFGATDDHLALAAAAVVEFDGGADLDNASGELLDPAIEHHDAMRTALDQDDPADELEAAGLSRNQIDGELQRFDEPEPPDIPEPDPGRVPRTDDDGTPPNTPPEA
jgi:hypothetical protein